MKTAQRIAKLRKERHMTQRRLAGYIHISPSNVCKYESGKAYPSLTILIRLADIFGVNVEYLLGRTNIRTPLDRLDEQLHIRLKDGWTELREDEKEAVVLQKLNK